jgi:hypothetical protein
VTLFGYSTLHLDKKRPLLDWTKTLLQLKTLLGGSKTLLGCTQHP